MKQNEVSKIVMPAYWVFRERGARRGSRQPVCVVMRRDLITDKLDKRLRDIEFVKLDQDKRTLMPQGAEFDVVLYVAKDVARVVDRYSDQQPKHLVNSLNDLIGSIVSGEGYDCVSRNIKHDNVENIIAQNLEFAPVRGENQKHVVPSMLVGCGDQPVCKLEIEDKACITFRFSPEPSEPIKELLSRAGFQQDFETKDGLKFEKWSRPDDFCGRLIAKGLTSEIQKLYPIYTELQNTNVVSVSWFSGKWNSRRRELASK